MVTNISWRDLLNKGGRVKIINNEMYVRDKPILYSFSICKHVNIYSPETCKSHNSHPLALSKSGKVRSMARHIFRKIISQT
jgi:hypothetical protein